MTSTLGLEFVVRSFEDVVRVFRAENFGLKAGVKNAPPLKRGQTKFRQFEYASFSPTPAVEDSSARSAVPWPAIYLSGEAAVLDSPIAFIDTLADLPAVCRKGRGTLASGAYVATSQFMIASLRVTLADDALDDARGHRGWPVAAAVWKVEEGWCWAVAQGAPSSLLPLIGLAALPPEAHWQSVQHSLGNW